MANFLDYSSGKRQVLGVLRMNLGDRGREGALSGTVVFPLFLAVLVQALVFAVYGLPPDSGFVGPDSFTRMARVRELLAHGWFGPQLPRLAPDGLDHHWTRAQDGLIAGLRWVLLPVLPGDRALYWAGILVSPLLHVAAVVSTMLILRRRLSEDALHVLALVILAAAPVPTWFVPARPDHHSLQIALMVVLMASVFVCAQREAPTWRCVPVGVLAAALAWAAPGGLLPAGAVLAGFAPLWLLYGSPYATRGGVAAGIAAMATLPALWLEHGSLAPVFAFDRLSFIHLGFFMAVAIGLATARASERLVRTLRGRALVAGFGAVVGISGLLVTLPGILTGASIADTAESYRQIRGSAIAESRILFNLAGDDYTSTSRALRDGILYGGLFLAGLFTCLWAARYQQLRPMIVIVATVLTAYAVYYQDRFGGLLIKNMGYLSAVVAIPYAAVLGHRATELRRRGRFAWPLLTTIVKVGAATWMLLATLIPANTGPGTDGRRTDTCNVGSVQAVLGRLAQEATPNARILAVPEVGAELLYYTDFRVFAIPTHRRQPLFEEMYRTLASPPAAAADRMRTLNVSGIVACPRFNGYFERQGLGDDILHATAVQGGDVPGLERLTKKDSDVQVYKVVTD